MGYLWDCTGVALDLDCISTGTAKTFSTIIQVSIYSPPATFRIVPLQFKPSHEVSIKLG